MADLSILFQDVSFTYDSASQPLIRHFSAHLTPGWTGIVGADGAGKSTILKLATGELSPQEGRVITPELTIYCRQRTDEAPDKLTDFLHAVDRGAFRIRGRLGVEADWLERWHTLSHGERKRAQIAVAMWRKPQVLAVDEPTNHLDIETQDLLYLALSTFNGVGLLASHDRKLLDDLCHQCLFVDPPNSVLRPGNYSQGLQQAQIESASAQKQRTRAKHDFMRLKREAAMRRDAAARAIPWRSKKGLAVKDHDAREKINVARVTGKDGAAGKGLNQLKGRLSQARKKMDSSKYRKPTG